MEQLKKNMDYQTLLVLTLKNSIPSQFLLVDVIAQLLDISRDAAYRRIRGEKKFDIEELNTICRAYNLSIDKLFAINSNDSIFNYVSLDLTNLSSYLAYMQNLSRTIELVKDSKEKEIILSATDIPIFHFLPFKELTLFKLYAWINTAYDYNYNFQYFLDKMDSTELFHYYKKISADYAQIPSKEVWTTNTVETIIKLLDFYYETGYFSNVEMPILLCHQLLQLVDNLKLCVERGYKGNNPSCSFNFYVSDTDLENSFILLRQDNSTKCMIKLFTINSLTTSDECFCNETLNWLNNSIKRSVLLSNSAKKDRFRFFNVLQMKVVGLIKKLENSST